MPIEKAFAIEAEPHVIFRALEEDLASASAHDGSVFEVIRRDPGKTLDLRVTMGGVPCRLTYTLTPKAAYTEVAAALQPFGWKYAVFRIITFGMSNHSFEVSLVEGLANLKAAVESKESPGDDAPEVEPDATRQA